MAPLAARLEHTTRIYGLNPPAARAFCLREDAGRRRYLRKYLKAEIDDPLLYHLCLNTGLIGFDEAARLIAEAVQGPGTSVGGEMSKGGMIHPSAALAHRAELQYTQLVRL